VTAEFRTGDSRGKTSEDPSEPSVGIGRAPSTAVRSDVAYTIFLPPGYRTSIDRYPTLYLLHGRGHTMAAWEHVREDLRGLMGRGEVPEMIVVMPDAPWAGGGHWYVDSSFQGAGGAGGAGQAVETALVRDLIAHIDSSYRTSGDRAGRVIAGYSMGGYGALRYTLGRPDVFSAGIVLSPAVFVPLPPAIDNIRDYGAFGLGDRLFDDDRYTELNYPNLLSAFDRRRPVRLFLAVGDKEYSHPNPADAGHDLEFETAVLYAAVKRVAGITADLRVLGGGHDWDVWRPALVEGLRLLDWPQG
jgi:enterochelin esterase-like enzyme